MQEEKMIIIGSGPAGYTAALYAARANIEPLLFAGNEPGGQVALTYEVENYPGFPEGANGPDLIDSFRKQAEKFGTRVEYDHVTEVDWNGPPFIVKTLGGREYSALSIIVTSGASPRKLNVPGERELVGHGVSYCGTCDGFFFKGKDVLVIGGGDSAIEEGLFLTRFATHVRVIHRRDSLRASKILQDRASRNEKMSYIWDTVVESIHHNEAGVVDRVEVKNLKTGETSSLKTDGIFIFIGHDPNNQFLDESRFEMEDGYLVTDKHMMTSVPGVFAAGEIQDSIYRQVATSVGQGCAAAMSAIHWVEDLIEERAAASVAG